MTSSYITILVPPRAVSDPSEGRLSISPAISQGEATEYRQSIEVREL